MHTLLLQKRSKGLEGRQLTVAVGDADAYWLMPAVADPCGREQSVWGQGVALKPCVTAPEACT